MDTDGKRAGKYYKTRNQPLYGATKGQRALPGRHVSRAESGVVPPHSKKQRLAGNAGCLSQTARFRRREDASAVAKPLRRDRLARQRGQRALP
jgi:hypothetical protein